MDTGTDAFEIPATAAVIGRGPVGTVYLLQDAGSAGATAVKVFDAGVVPEPAGLDHPHVAAVTARGRTSSGLEFVAGAYRGGGNLADRVAAKKRSWHETVGLGIRLAGALESAHRAGLVHGGVKPTNVLFGSVDEAVPILADFGHRSWTAAAEGADGVELGFYAPEVLGGAEPTARADVYALAATLHYTITSVPPFARREGEPLLATLGRILTDDVTDVRPLRVPDALAGALERAMSKDPSERPASAREFAEELQEVERAQGHRVTELVVAGEAPSATVVDVTRPALADGPPTRSRSSAKWWLLGIFAAVAVVAVSVLVVLAIATSEPLQDATPATQAPPTAATTPPASTAPPAPTPEMGADRSVFPDIPGYHLADIAQDSMVTNPDLADAVFQSAYVAGVRQGGADGPDIAVFTVLVLQPEHAGDPAALAAILSAIAPDAGGAETGEIAGIPLVVTTTADGQTLFAWQDTTELVANLLQGPDRAALEAFLAAPGVLTPVEQ